MSTPKTYEFEIDEQTYTMREPTMLDMLTYDAIVREAGEHVPDRLAAWYQKNGVTLVLGMLMSDDIAHPGHEADGEQWYQAISAVLERDPRFVIAFMQTAGACMAASSKKTNSFVTSLSGTLPPLPPTDSQAENPSDIPATTGITA